MAWRRRGSFTFRAAAGPPAKGEHMSKTPKPKPPAPAGTERLTAEIVGHCVSQAADLRETPYTRFCKDLGNATPVEVEDWPTLTKGQRGLVAAMLESPKPQDVRRLPFPRFRHEANEYLVRHAMETGALAPDFDARQLADYAAGHHFPMSAEGRKVLMDASGPAAGGPPAATGAPAGGKKTKTGGPFAGRSCSDLRIQVTGDGLRVKLAAESKPGPGVLVKWADLGCRVTKAAKYQHPLIKLCSELTQVKAPLSEVPRSTLSTWNARFRERTGICEEDRLWRRSGDTITSAAQWFNGSS